MQHGSNGRSVALRPSLCRRHERPATPTAFAGRTRAGRAQLGSSLVALPAEAWPLVNEYPTDDGLIALDVPLCTAEDGRSD